MAAVRIAINDESLKGPLVWSLFVHGILAVTMLVSTFLSHRGEGWGGPGAGAVSVTLVGGLQGVPLPRPEVVTQSRVVDNTKGLYKSEPVPKVKPPVEKATELPEFAKEKPKRIISEKSRVLEDDTPPPPNAVPYGQGGSPSVPYSSSSFSLGPGGATTAGMGFGGPGAGGGGDFGSHYSWYVDAVRSRVSSNWLQSTVDPAIRFAPRAVVTFDILRSGSVANVQVLKSSGNSSVDNSAVRAILGSSPLQALPNEYSGGKVSVEFWFDFKR
jgi:periplasmic protein TonB